MVQTLNLWTIKWLETIWTVSWQSGILVVVVFLVTKVLKNRLTPTIRHILWTLVVAKLLITPFVAIPITVRVNSPALPAPAVLPITLPAVQESGSFSLPVNTQSNTLSPVSLFFLFWLFGITAIFLLTTTRSVRLCRQVRSAEALENKDILEAVARGAKQLNLKPPSLKVSGEFTGPFVCGLLNPVLVVPRQVLTKFKSGELEHIILHELAHLKRRDVLTNWLQALAQTLYFFNPLVWYVNRQIRLEREQSCDDWALQVKKGERKEYADALLKIIELCPKPTGLALNVVGISEPFTSMRRRLEMVMDTGRRISTKVSLKTLLVLVVLGLIGMPAYGVTKKLVTTNTLLAAGEKITAVTEASNNKVATNTVLAPTEKPKVGEPTAQAQTPINLEKTLVTINAAGIDIRPMLREVYTTTGVNIVLSAGVTNGPPKFVTLYFKNMPLRQALNLIMDATNLKYIIKDDVVRIMTPEEYESSPATTIIQRLVTVNITSGDKLITSPRFMTAAGQRQPMVIKFDDTELQLMDGVTKDTDGMFVLRMKLYQKDKDGGPKLMSTPIMRMPPGTEGKMSLTESTDGHPGYSISIKVTDVK
ncbi:MAG: M56 family metallopeptidase [Candidatus Ratteibacteria bacterium]